MTTVRWSRACAAGLETAVSLLSVHLDEVKEHLLLEDMCLPDIRFYIQLDTRSILDGWSVWTVLAPHYGLKGSMVDSSVKVLKKTLRLMKQNFCFA